MSSNEIKQLITKGNLDCTLRQIEEIHVIDRLEALLLKSQIFEQKRYFEEAYTLAKEAIRVSKSEKNQIHELRAKIRMACIAWTFQRHVSFHSTLTDCEHLFQVLSAEGKEVGKEWEGNFIELQGIAFLHKKKTDNALDCFQKTLELFRELDIKGRMANTLTKIGLIQQKKRALELALALYKESLDLRDEIGNKREIANSLTLLGRIYREQRKLDQSLEYFERSLDLNKELGNKMETAILLDEISLIFQNKEDSTRAMKFRKMSSAIQQSMDHPEYGFHRRLMERMDKELRSEMQDIFDKLDKPDWKIPEKMDLKEYTPKENGLFEAREVVKLVTRDEKRIPVLKGINLAISKGSFVFLRGASGSGKTTFLRVLAGLDKVDMGTVYFEGRSLTEMGDNAKSQLQRQKFAFILAHSVLYQGKDLTLQSFNNPDAPLDFSNVPITLQESLSKMLEGVESIEVWYQRLSEAEKGDEDLSSIKDWKEIYFNKERMIIRSIAKLVTHTPAIIFADEPTDDMSNYTAGVIMDLLKKYAEETGATIILTTHRGQFADYATHQIFLRNGQITMTLESA